MKLQEASLMEKPDPRKIPQPIVLSKVQQWLVPLVLVLATVLWSADALANLHGPDNPPVLNGPHTGDRSTNPPGRNSTIPVLLIEDVRPRSGRSSLMNEIYIYGASFADGVVVHLVQTSGTEYPLETTRLSWMQLAAVVPAGVAPGIYDLKVLNPDGGQAVLARAYTVFDPLGDDLKANDYELWTEPVALRARGSKNDVGLIVHRQGGKQPVSVTVRFYEGDPDNGGTLLGDGTIAMLSPRSSQSTSKVAWNPTSAGEYELYAVIDPDNRVPEALESNNKVHRTVTVLPPVADLVAPRVDNFVIDEGN
ncbi:hypothetical protein GC175_04755, partial [bacterium]|nr:hypothetical protein [bacterium]